MPLSRPPVPPRRLDLWPWRLRPCDLLPDERARAVGIGDVPEAGGANLVATCEWDEGEEGTTLKVFLLPREDRLTAAYLGAYRWAFFAETSLSGFPAVAVAEEKPPAGECRAVVGVAEQQGFEVRLRVGPEDAAPGGDACDRALQVAGMVVDRVAKG